MHDPIKVGMGELKVGLKEDILAAYGIGSCVAVICYDRNRPLACMLHAILPERVGSRDKGENKYVETGIDNMIKMLIEHKTSINDMEAKIVGGAKMFEIKSESTPIGERNVLKAKEILGKKGIRIAAEDTGSNYGRTVEFTVTDKKAVVRSFIHGLKTI